MPETASGEPWTDALRTAVTTLTGAGLELDDGDEAWLAQLMRTGWERATAEGNTTGYADAADELAQQLTTLLQHPVETSGVEQRDVDEAASADEPTARRVPAAFAALCPGFWPFC